MKTSRSIQGIFLFPDFEMWTRIASSLNKIIQNSDFKKKVNLEELKAQKADRFLRGRQIAYLIYDYHLGQNNYSFDALQAYCFGINIKL